MNEEQKILDQETAKRLKRDLDEARRAIDEAEVGTLDRVEAHRRLRKVFDEINSYFV